MKSPLEIAEEEYEKLQNKKILDEAIEVEKKQDAEHPPEDKDALQK